MSQPMDRRQLETIAESIADGLEGEWLLLGGALVSLWLDARRTTEDIDLVSLGEGIEARYALLQFAVDQGWPLEAVNSAADFFVRRFPDWREQIETFHRGKKSTLYRPTPTLFLLLKASRLTEQDLQDCLAMLQKTREEGLAVDLDRVREHLAGLPPAEDPAHAVRRVELRAELDAAST